MVRNYKQFNESIKHLLVGPTDDEYINAMEDINGQAPNYYLIDCVNDNVLRGVKRALELGANINYHSDIITIAIKNNNMEMVKFLIDNGADVKGSFNHALYISIINNRLDYVKLLVDKGADVNQVFQYMHKGKIYYNTALDISRIKKFKEIEKYLLNNGAITFKEENITSGNNYYLNYDDLNESIRSLLVGPTEDEVLDQLKDNPQKLLDYSIRNNFLSGIKYAVTHGADVFKLVRSLKLNIDSLEIIKFLKEEYDIIIDDFSYNIHKIINDNNKLMNSEYFIYLVENGLDVNYDYDFYLRVAAYDGYVDIAKLLIKKGAHVQSLNNQAIWQASMNGHLEMVKLLVENGADIHTTDDRPLRFAAGMGHLEMVKYCLTKNPSLTSVVISLEEAQEQKFLDVVEVLKKYIIDNDKKV